METPDRRTLILERIASNKRAFEEANDRLDAEIYYRQMRQAELELRSFDVV